MAIDWVLVRQWADDEPSYVTWGIEKSSTTNKIIQNAVLGTGVY